ncbi:MAG TPA: AsmA family protein, partial [Xanthomonadaceae bacterium]|nr:AsmA family protein [Xanthomonadaceae bacterium]
MNSPSPTQRGRALQAVRRHPFLTALGALLLGVLVLIAIWDWNWLRGPIERIVHAQTGRTFDIGGDLDVDLGRVTTVRMDAVRFGNADWSEQRDMAAGDRVQFSFEILPAIFKREFRMPELRLTRPRLRLELGSDGTGNWVFGDRDEPGRPLQVQQLWVDNGRLQYLDAKGRTDIDVQLQSRARSAAAADIAVEGSGRWKGNPFTLQGIGESPLALQDTQQPYRIDLRASAGATHAHARGTLLDPLRFRDFDLKLALSGQNMEDLFPLIGVAIPPTPPY